MTKFKKSPMNWCFDCDTVVDENTPSSLDSYNSSSPVSTTTEMSITTMQNIKKSMLSMTIP
jgi:hypothetical protein